MDRAALNATITIGIIVIRKAFIFWQSTCKMHIRWTRDPETEIALNN
jgi:hypothetical protein